MRRTFQERRFQERRVPYSLGFILPSVLAISYATILIMVTLLMVATSSSVGNYTTHYQKLADEAAEAGAAYATGCLSLYSHAQTWGPAVSKPNLAPNTDCSGANNYASNAYVYNSGNVQTYFSVGNLDYTSTYSVQISATGYTNVLGSGGTVLQTYTSVQKKVITWPNTATITMSASGSYRTCSIVNGQVYCWGFNAYGQLGNGQYLGTGNIEASSSIDSLVPVKVEQDPGVMAGKQIVKVFVAQYHSCALSADGLMYCWGYNYEGQLGNGTRTDSPVPVQVKGALSGQVITDIGGSNNASCAIAGGKIYCWGSNSSGLTGLNLTSGNTLTPTLVTASNTATTLPTNYTATALSTSGSRSLNMCAIVGGKAYCWGENSYGSVGDGTTTAVYVGRLVPTKVVDTGVLSGKTVTTITQDGSINNGTNADNPHVCVLASGGLYCWGDNTDGQLGNGTTTSSSVPVAVDTSGVLNGLTIQDVKAGIYHTCAMANNGIYCWGKNNYGQVGDGTNTTRQSPVAVTQQAGALSASNVVSIGAGSNRSCAVTTDGRSFCWGNNQNGQIGDGTIINRAIPTESLFLRPIANQYIF